MCSMDRCVSVFLCSSCSVSDGPAALSLHVEPLQNLLSDSDKAVVPFACAAACSAALCMSRSDCAKCLIMSTMCTAVGVACFT